MQIKLYEPKYRSDLERLLNNFGEEVWDSLPRADVDLFVSSHWAVYLAVTPIGSVVGFSAYILNHYYGLREPTVGNTYIYVDSLHRTSRAMYMFSLQSGRICVENNLALEHYYGSEESTRLSSKLKGDKIYETYIYEVDEVSRVFNKLKNKVRIKE